MLSNLFYTIGVIDKATSPMNKIRKNTSKMSQSMTAGVTSVGIGLASLVGVGAAIEGSLAPAIDMSKALGEVKSLGVLERDLKMLQNTALDFTSSFGGSASAFVRAAYDIQSAISGLTGKELSSFTSSAAIAAKATKADVGTITDLYGTMYSVFESEAQRMGKANWVENMTGQFALAVNMYKTDGNKVSQSFKTLGAAATSAGYSMAEQFAVLGQLGNAKDGAVAATAWTAMLSTAYGAQEKLGLKFVDVNNKLLSTPAILDKLRGKFGDTLDAAEGAQIQKAFGGEAFKFIDALYTKTGDLNKNIAALQNNKGMANATRMAKDMTDPWDRFHASVTAVRIQFGMTLLPVINPVIDKMSVGLKVLRGWIDQFPYLTKVIGLAVFGLIAFTAAMAAFYIVVGIAKMVIASLRILMILWNVTIWILKASLFILKVIGILGVVAAVIIMAAIMVVIKIAMIAWSVAVWLVNSGLLACPITWIVLGIIALVVIVILAVIYWDKLKDAIVGVAKWFDSMPGWVQILAMIFLPFIFIPLKIIANWDKIKAFFVGLWDKISSGARSCFDWVIDKINLFIRLVNKIPGVNIEWRAGEPPNLPTPKKIIQTFDTQEAKGRVKGLLPTTKARNMASANQAVQALINSQQTDNSKKSSIGTVNIKTTQSIDPAMLRSIMEMESKR
jgi:TP901 family phage tail tape measure protein